MGGGLQKRSLLPSIRGESEIVGKYGEKGSSVRRGRGGGGFIKKREKQSVAHA